MLYQRLISTIKRWYPAIMSEHSNNIIYADIKIISTNTADGFAMIDPRDP